VELMEIAFSRAGIYLALKLKRAIYVKEQFTTCSKKLSAIY